eukprot:669797-Rhodomonas_salina.4
MSYSGNAASYGAKADIYGCNVGLYGRRLRAWACDAMARHLVTKVGHLPPGINRNEPSLQHKLYQTRRLSCLVSPCTCTCPGVSCSGQYHAALTFSNRALRAEPETDCLVYWSLHAGTKRPYFSRRAGTGVFLQYHRPVLTWRTVAPGVVLSKLRRHRQAIGDLAYLLRAPSECA